MAKTKELIKSCSSAEKLESVVQQEEEGGSFIESFSLEEIGDPELNVENISPEKAQLYLSTQKINRTPTESRIRDYAERMMRGEWKLSQPIQFTSDGDLFDGQHRLLAVIRAKMSVDFLVVRNLPPETRYYVDIGQTRRTAQIAQLMGMGGKTHMATKLATCKAMFIGADLKYKNQKAEQEAKKQGGTINKTISPHRQIELYHLYSDGIDFADQAKSFCTAPVRAVIARAYYHENHDRLQQFIDVLTKGYPITGCDEAAIALRNSIMEIKGGFLGGSMARLSLYKKTISALSHFMSRRNVRYVKEKDIELYPLADFD